MNNLIAFILMLILGLESFLNQHGQIHPGIHLFIQWFFGPFMLLPVLAMVILEAEGKWKKLEVVFCACIGYLFGLYIFAL
jgi:hypothetical protein